MISTPPTESAKAASPLKRYTMETVVTVATIRQLMDFTMLRKGVSNAIGLLSPKVFFDAVF